MNDRDSFYKMAGGIFNLVVGLILPLGCLLLRFTISGQISGQPFPDALWIELRDNLFFYIYLFASSILSCLLFGFCLNFLRNETSKQIRSLESFHKVLELRQNDLQNINDSLKNQTVIDYLTGLFNRRYLWLELEKEVERAKRLKALKHVLSAIMIDVDNFKGINDRHGHQVGDYVLQEVAQLLKRSIRVIDLVGRYGGDEFLVILPEANDITVQKVAERIQSNVHDLTLRFAGEELKVTLSLGISTVEYIESSNDIDVLIEKADQSLLAAKKGGKDKIVSG
ncbi:MAG TPA: GGDEF domain-containing protein [Candidatus Omnitrophota bacterium]|nr:GGDEF domain-containing protein [Candidatus Omnitrophota bacterium]